MPAAYLLLTLLAIASGVYFLGRRHALAAAQGRMRTLHSLPAYYGYYTVLWALTPALFTVLVWLAVQPLVVQQLVIASLPSELREQPPATVHLLLNSIKNVASGAIAAEPPPAVRSAAEHYRTLQRWGQQALTIVALVLTIAGAYIGQTRIHPRLRARNVVEKAVMVLLIGSSTIAIFTTVGIVLSVLFESVRFFQAVPITDFLFGLNWSPQTALRADQVGSSGAFGAVPLFVGTFLISFIAMVVAAPIGLMSAIYLSEYAHPQFRAYAKPALEVLAGIPTVVYGFFAALVVAPLIRTLGTSIGLDVASESALAAGLVMGVMIIPFVSSLSDDVINAVPQALRDGAYSLGATHSETILKVVVPAALPGIVGSLMLAISRAVGETMIVVMAAGLAGNLSFNPLDAVTTVTVQIVTLLTGDQEFDSPKTLAAFALGLMLFLSTLLLNVFALHIVRKYREQYE